jgi:hypothetical protein
MRRRQSIDAPLSDRGSVNRVARHLRQASGVLAGNAVSLGLGAATGLLLARWMGVAEYGIYNIVATVMGAMTVLTKGGVHLGFTAILGRTWPDLRRAAQAIAAMRQVRRRLSMLVMPAVLLFSAAVLHMAGASGALVVAMLAALVLFWFADVRTRIVDQTLFFAGQAQKVQWLDTLLAALRLCAVLMLFLLGGVNIYSVVAVAVLLAMLRVAPVLRWVRQLVPPEKQIAQADDLREISRCVRRQFPVDLYYVCQAQLVLFVLATWGSQENLAGYGAVTRIAQLLAPLQAFTYAYCVPLFSRATSRILERFAALVGLLSIPGFALTLLAWLWPESLLLLVGDKYSGLHSEILVASAVVSLASVAGNAWSLVAHRGWVRWSWLQIPCGLVWCGVAPFVLDLGTINGALLLWAGFSCTLILATLVEIAPAVLARRGKALQ